MQSVDADSLIVRDSAKSESLMRRGPTLPPVVKHPIRLNIKAYKLNDDGQGSHNKSFVIQTEEVPNNT